MKRSLLWEYSRRNFKLNRLLGITLGYQRIGIPENQNSTSTFKFDIQIRHSTSMKFNQMKSEQDAKSAPVRFPEETWQTFVTAIKNVACAVRGNQLSLSFSVLLAFITSLCPPIQCHGEPNIIIRTQIAEPMGADSFAPISLENDEVFCRAVNRIPKEFQNEIYFVFSIFNKLVQKKQAIFLEVPYLSENDMLYNDYLSEFLNESSKPHDIEAAYLNYFQNLTRYSSEMMGRLTVFDVEQIILRNLISFAPLSKIKEYINHLQVVRSEGDPSKWEELLEMNIFPQLRYSSQNPDPKVREYLDHLNKIHQFDTSENNLSQEEAPKYFEREFLKCISSIEYQFENLITNERTKGKQGHSLQIPVGPFYQLQNLYLEMESWRKKLRKEVWDSNFGHLEDQFQFVMSQILSRTRQSISDDCEKYKEETPDPPNEDPTSSCEQEQVYWLNDVLKETNKSLEYLSERMYEKSAPELQKVFHTNYRNCHFDGKLILKAQNPFISLENSGGVTIRTIVYPSPFFIQDIKDALQLRY